MSIASSSTALSVLVCTRNAPETLDLLFASLAVQQWSDADEVILVDNGIEAARRETIRLRLDQLAAEGVHTVYRKEERTGLTHARLTGFRSIRNPWVFLLDDDNSLEIDCVFELHKTLQAHPELGGICPRIEPIWEGAIPPWVISLGHDVLSYNASSLYETPYAWKEWAAGERGMRPPGGGMIIRKSAIERFIELCHDNPAALELGHRGSVLGSGEDILLYTQLYREHLPTAYTNSIRVYHRVPAGRTSFTYLRRLFFSVNRDFGIVALMFHGKWLFPASLAHSILRLGSRLSFALRLTPSWQPIIATLAAFLGYFYGTIVGILQPGQRKISLRPRDP